MKLKNRYILRYLCYRAIPVLLIASLLLLMLIIVSNEISDKREATTMIVLAVAATSIIAVYFVINIYRFSHLIKKQSSIYNVKFDDGNAVTVCRWSRWLIITDNWLIEPGKLALYRKHIKSVAIAPVVMKGYKCKVRIKMKSGENYGLLLDREETARKIRNWAKR